MGNRVPGKALEAARKRADGGDHALFAALDACPVLGLDRDEMEAIDRRIRGVARMGDRHLMAHVQVKLWTALSVSEANDG